jgi:hypothetical protein
VIAKTERLTEEINHSLRGGLNRSVAISGRLAQKERAEAKFSEEPRPAGVEDYKDG